MFPRLLSLKQIKQHKVITPSEFIKLLVITTPPTTLLVLISFAGYKEFHNYLTTSEPSEKEFSLAIEEMKQSTRQYAKRQISWIRNKLLPVIHAANTDYADDGPPCPTYLLDATGTLDGDCRASC
jgi:IPP transferase